MFRKYVPKIIVGLAAIAFLAGVTYGISRLEANWQEEISEFENQKETSRVADLAYLLISGKDRIISPLESREFLDFAGYDAPISENECVFFGFRGPGYVEVVIGSKVDFSGGLFSGVTSSYGRDTFYLDRNVLEKYIDSKLETGCLGLERCN